MPGPIYLFPILLFSVVLHEVSHGYLALKLGDPTARDLGRLTLNPLPHIDLFGSIIVPLLSLAASGSVFIAWAKPVPINAANFARPRRDDMLVAAIGPFSNLLMAFACALAVITLTGVARPMSGSDVDVLAQLWKFLTNMFYGGVYLNIVLAVFNLIPVPPLDGSHVLAAVLPAHLSTAYKRIGFAGILVIILLMRIPAFSGAFYSVIGTIFEPFRLMMDAFL